MDLDREAEVAMSDLGVKRDDSECIRHEGRAAGITPPEHAPSGGLLPMPA